MLPRITTLNDYKKIYADSKLFLPALREICCRHGFSGPLVREKLGSHIVYSVENLILKVFCPLWLHDFQAERIALTHLNGVYTPLLIGEGELNGWPYLVISKLEGVPVGSVWSTMSLKERSSIVRQLGKLMRWLHNQPLPENMPIDWGNFLRERLTKAEAHHGMIDPWFSWIREQLFYFQEPSYSLTLLNGDITDDHVLLKKQGGTWEISGLIDFGDARVGHPYYEFTAPLAHYTYGNPTLSMILLESYGLELKRSVFDTLTKYCLLHEFATLTDFFDRLQVSTPEQFNKALWGDAILVHNRES